VTDELDVRAARTPFSDDEYDRRISTLREELGRSLLDCFVAFTSSWFRIPGAVTYCCGYEPYFGSALFVYLVDSHERHLIVDDFWDVIGRPDEEERSREHFHLADDVGAVLGKLLPRRRLRVGLVNEDFMPRAVARSVEAALDPHEVVEAQPQLDYAREVKSPEELEALRATAAISDQAITAFRAAASLGTTERSIAADMLDASLRAGADRFWTPVSVASGPRSAQYYAFPTDRRPGPGESIHTDLGVRAGGYHGDVQRVVLRAGRPAPEVARIVAALPLIQAALIDGVRPGVRAGEVYDLFRRLVHEHDVAAFLPRRREIFAVGHGIGSEGHESPALAEGSDTLLREGMVVTLEPMLFAEGIGGGGIEDMVLVTGAGGERLTQSPHAPELA
jgi:Xaa-Pro aminopeptidase